MKKDIILIGPVGTGKSTIGKLLSKDLGIPQASLDDIRWKIYKESGYDFELADEIMQREGFLGIYRYWKPFEAYSVKRALELYPDHIHDFGAGQSVYEDEELFKEVQNALEPYSNIVLLLPSEDREKCLQILFERTQFEHNSLFINNPSNEKLAKIIVYTDGKKLKEITEEIIRKVKL
ncbi:shikimate kinase [Psychrilyobacter atlanticus]|uniref:shikimate kinase n=1 Tax=Psychrilyobacter atlanticus TaxID=271091 RepID=UPI0003F8F328|nr:hypothetical protein [Psychrilyobacter atlanticus]